VIRHTSSFPVGGQPGEEGGKKKTMPLREVGGAQTCVQTGKAKNHTDPHDP